MKKFAPLLMVLLAASLRSWTQLPRLPKIVPTRANCAVQTITLNQNIHDVYWARVGRPEKIDRYFPKGECGVQVWSWADHLQVRFHHIGIASVKGNSLSLGLNECQLNRGDHLSKAHFLGTPTRSENGIASWCFPTVQMNLLVDKHQRVESIEIKQPSGTGCLLTSK